MKIFPEYEVVWNTTEREGTPWREDFTAANAGIVQHVCNGPSATGNARTDAWRNCDRNIRNWWRENSGKVAAPWVVILEWDVLVRGDMAAALGVPGRGAGLIGAAVMQGVRDRFWPGFQDIPRLPKPLQAGAIGIVPLAAAALPREAMDELARDEWDEVFSLDILSELRLPSVLAHQGWKIARGAAMGNVGTRPLPYPGGDALGIFHPVKSR